LIVKKWLKNHNSSQVIGCPIHRKQRFSYEFSQRTTINHEREKSYNFSNSEEKENSKHSKRKVSNWVKEKFQIQ
jgi:hypothetical protein